MTIQDVQDRAFEFAKEMGLTNEQTISFTLALMVQKGFSYVQAFDFVLGRGAHNRVAAQVQRQMGIRSY